MRFVKYEENKFDIDGCISIQQESDWVMPWRILYAQRALFFGISETETARGLGVRLSFSSDTVELAMIFEENHPRFQLDLYVDDLLLQQLSVAANQKVVNFDILPPDEKHIEIWLDHRCPVKIKAIGIDEIAKIDKIQHKERHWVHYGGFSGLSEEVESPSAAWTVQAAKRKNLSLTNLSCDGSCRFETIFARMIRDLSFDYLTVLLEGGPQENYFNLPGWLEIIREKHPREPIILITSLFREKQFSEDITVSQIVEVFQSSGDDRIFLVSGADLVDLSVNQQLGETQQHQIAVAFDEKVFTAEILNK